MHFCIRKDYSPLLAPPTEKKRYLIGELMLKINADRLFGMALSLLLLSGCAANYEHERRMYPGDRLSINEVARVYRNGGYSWVRAVDGVELSSSYVNTIFEFVPGPHILQVEVGFIADRRGMMITSSHAFYNLPVDLKAGYTYVPDNLAAITELAPASWCMLEELHDAKGVTYPKNAIDYKSLSRTPSPDAIRVGCGRRIK